MLQLKHYSQWQQVKPIVAPLLAQQHSFFLTLEWFDNFVATALEQKQQLLFLTLQEGQTLVGFLPLTFVCQECRWFRPIRFASLSNYYSSYFAPVMLSGYESQCLQHWAQWLAVKADVVQLSPIPEYFQHWQTLLQAFRKQRWQTNRYFIFGNWYQDGIRDFEQYWQQRPSRLRNTVRRQINKVSKTHTLRFELIEHAEHLTKALPLYQHLYRLRWGKDEPFEYFIPNLLRTCAKKSQLRMGLLYVDEHVVAAQIWFVHDAVGYIFKLAYDQQWASFSVGSILTYYLAQHTIQQDGVKTLDFLTGDDAYKQDWMTQRTPCYGVECVNLRTSVGQLLALRNVVVRLLKRCVCG